jgi:hypothetical protein
MTKRAYALLLLGLASSCHETPTEGGRLLEFPTPGQDSGAADAAGMAGETGAPEDPPEDANAGAAGAAADDD